MQKWIKNKGTDLYICNSCWDNIINRQITSNNRRFYQRQDKFKEYRKQIVRTSFGNAKLITPRIGVCNMCRAVVPFDCYRTHTHHTEYNINDLSKNTIELCPACHAKEGLRLEQICRNPSTGRLTNKK